MTLCFDGSDQQLAYCFDDDTAVHTRKIIFCLSKIMHVMFCCSTTLDNQLNASSMSTCAASYRLYVLLRASMLYILHNAKQ